MAFPPGFLDELRNRISLAELIGKRVRLTRRGREHIGLCPFHSEKTPSFSVVEDKQFFHCFGCGAHGDAIDYAMRADNVDFVEAIERLAGIAGLAVPQSTPQERERAQRQTTLLEAMEAAALFYEKRLWSPFGRAGLDYLRERGLDDETIRRFRLGSAPEDRQTLRRALSGEYPEPMLLEAGLLRASDRGGEPYDYFGNRVMFPITDRAGRVIAFGARTLGDDQPKYLNSPDTPLFEKGRVLYNWAAARAQIGREGDVGGNGVIVTEGYMDVIALDRAGFQTGVAPLGTALTETQLQELWRLSPEPVLCFDGDSAGQRAALRVLNRALPVLGPARTLRFATLPTNDDPDSFIRERGRDAFESVLNGALPVSMVIWQSELRRRPIDTPERRADLRARLMKNIDLVTDNILKFEYRGFLLDRYYELSRSVRLGKFRTARDVDPQRVPLPPPPEPMQRALLLYLLIRNPDKIPLREEQIANLDFPEPEYSHLRAELQDVLEMRPEINPADLRSHLADVGFGETLGILDARVYRHGIGTFQYIEESIDEFLTALSGGYRVDIENASRVWVANPTLENWERLQALKIRELDAQIMEEAPDNRTRA